MANANISNSSSTTSTGGYPRRIFKQLDDKFLCNYYRQVLKDPVQSFCGHRFCRACIEGVAKNGGENMCKQCQSEGLADDYGLLNENQKYHHCVKQFSGGCDLPLLEVEDCLREDTKSHDRSCSEDRRSKTNQTR